MSLSTLQTIKTQLLARIEEVTASSNPNYTIDGQTVNSASYLDTLFKQLGKVDEQINQAEPFEVVSRGIT